MYGAEIQTKFKHALEEPTRAQLAEYGDGERINFAFRHHEEPPSKSKPAGKAVVPESAEISLHCKTNSIKKRPRIVQEPVPVPIVFPAASYDSPRPAPWTRPLTREEELQMDMEARNARRFRKRAGGGGGGVAASDFCDFFPILPSPAPVHTAPDAILAPTAVTSLAATRTIVDLFF